MKYKTFEDIVDGTPTKRVYKYSRKELVKEISKLSYLQVSDVIKELLVEMLLATTPSSKSQPKEECPCCHGTGRTPDDGYDGDTYSQGTFCDNCNGTGKVKVKSQPKTKPCGCVEGVMNCNECLEPMSYKSQPKIEKIKRLLVITNFGEDETLYRKVNELIDAVNKLNSK